MKRRDALMAGAVLLALAAARGAAGAPQAAAPPPAPPAATAAAPSAATASCGDCHEQAAKFATNIHAHRAGAPAGDAVCATCHGDGAKHIEASGDKAFIRVARGSAGAEVCLTCHVKVDAHASYRNGINMRGEAVTCLSCHSIHAAAPRERALLSRPIDALCSSCHVTEGESFKSKPFAHHLGRGGMSCVSCHDPHGLARAGALKPTRGGELPCLSCHTEKRGPFVFSHVNGVAGDCLSCHESHGSSNPKRLIRARVSQLCLECHSAITPGVLGSQPPAFHDLRSPRYLNCTICHVAIHGSNRSPALLK
jgi:DmsE family decaheme c-type cytochrome